MTQASGLRRRSFSPSVAENNAAGAGNLAGPPRAIIPNEVMSRASVDTLPGEFELTGAPDHPIPQRLNFETMDEIILPRGAVASAEACREPAVSESESAGALPGPQSIGDLKPLGQISASYIVAVNGQGLWIVDQHVAHERVLFEKHLAARRAGELGGQRLLMPIVVELAPHQIVIFEQIEEELRANGFEAELMGPRSVAIAAAPAGIASGNAEKLLAEILDGVARESQAISLDSLQSRRPFLFFHIYEPHTPYTPPARFKEYAPYDGEIAAADEIVGRLVASLERRGLYDDALIVLQFEHAERITRAGEGRDCRLGNAVEPGLCVPE